MKTSKFTDEQIAMALRQAEAGTPVGEICRKLGVSQATFFRWKAKHGQMGTALYQQEALAPRRMARAIAAGPKEITDQARIMGTDAQGNRIVLREGNNDFICQPGKPQFVAQPASCYTTNSKPRITYMLAGATQRSISDPDDKTSTPLATGPNWMIMMPFDPKTTGLPVTKTATGMPAPSVLWATRISPWKGRLSIARSTIPRRNITHRSTIRA